MPGPKLAYRPRRWDTRVGTIELGIPKLREGSYFPSLSRRRSERDLVSVVLQAYVEASRRAASTTLIAGIEAGERFILALTGPSADD